MNIKSVFITIITATVWFLVVNLVNIAYGKELTSKQIIKKANKVMSQKTVKGKMKMTIVTTSGKKRTFVYESFSKNKGEKNLIRYLKPRRARGQAILMLNHADDIWAYFPRTKRVRRLATHAKRQKMQGSDFSYEDMGSGDTFLKDFDSQKLGSEEKEEHDCYKVELTRKEDSDAGYSRLIVWVIKENFFPVAIDYYDLKDPEVLIKSLVQYDIKVVDGVPTGMKMVMYDKRDNTQTTMKIMDVQYNVKLSDRMFTERSLRR